MNGNLTEAELLYRQALELDPEYCDAMDNLGQTLRQQGKIDEAILWYKKSLEVKPDNPVALQNLALAYNLQGETSKSIEMYEALVETAPENPEGYFGLGSIYYRLSQPEKAISYLTTAEKLYIQESSSYVSDAQYYLGFSYFEIQDCANTKKYFEAIYNLFSSDGNVNYALGVCYLQSEPKEIDTARNYILKAQEAGVQIPADVLKIIAEQ
ncbi:MAG: tetratricopeptide repeat protein [Anaerolineales bacterium]|nr:tetratricopeptide repeat protein [Anaerolineales bacterium]